MVGWTPRVKGYSPGKPRSPLAAASWACRRGRGRSRRWCGTTRRARGCARPPCGTYLRATPVSIGWAFRYPWSFRACYRLRSPRRNPRTAVYPERRLWWLAGPVPSAPGGRRRGCRRGDGRAPRERQNGRPPASPCSGRGCRRLRPSVGADCRISFGKAANPVGTVMRSGGGTRPPTALGASLVVDAGGRGDAVGRPVDMMLVSSVSFE